MARERDATHNRAANSTPSCPAFVPGIHVFGAGKVRRRGWPGQARPWRTKVGCRPC